MTLEKAKQSQNEFKSEGLNQGSKKVQCTILKHFKNHETVLLNFLMIILQLYLSLNLQQLLVHNYIRCYISKL